MNWNEFMERHDRWSGATLRSRIYALKDVGTNAEIISTVAKMPEEKYKAQLVRRAIKLGSEFSEEDIEALRSILAPATFNDVFLNPSDIDAAPVAAPAAPAMNEDEDEDEDGDDVYFFEEDPNYKPLKPRIRIFTKRNKVMDALAKLFGLPVPPEKRTVICGCPESCDECPKKKTGACK